MTGNADETFGSAKIIKSARRFQTLFLKIVYYDNVQENQITESFYIICQFPFILFV